MRNDTAKRAFNTIVAASLRWKGAVWEGISARVSQLPTNEGVLQLAFLIIMTTAWSLLGTVCVLWLSVESHHVVNDDGELVKALQGNYHLLTKDYFLAGSPLHPDLGYLMQVMDSAWHPISEVRIEVE